MATTLQNLPLTLPPSARRRIQLVQNKAVNDAPILHEEPYRAAFNCARCTFSGPLAYYGNSVYCRKNGFVSQAHWLCNDFQTDPDLPGDKEYALAAVGSPYPTLTGPTLSPAIPGIPLYKARRFKEQHTGVMIAFMLPQSAANVLAQDFPGALPASELHLTLTFMGDSTELKYEPAKLIEAVRAFAKNYGPVKGVLSGQGRFNTQELGGVEPVYASFDAPDLPIFRDALIAFLRMAGIPYVRNHGYTPHITLGYIPAIVAPLPPDLRVKPIELTFDKITVMWGGKRTDIELTGEPVPAYKAIRFKHLPGRHNQQVHGRRHIGGRVRELVREGIDKAEAKLKVARSILDDKNSSHTERRSALRVLPREERRAFYKKLPTENPRRSELNKRRAKPAELKVSAPERKAHPTRKVATTKAFGSDPNHAYEFQHEIVDLNDLITSNLDSGAINPDYTKELQPRIRERVASRQQVDKIAKTFVPESSIWDFHQLDKGPAIIGPDNMVESGNGRTMAMRKMAAEHPEKWKEYQTKLRENLESLGLTEADLKGKKHPVVVRRRLSQVDRAEFAKEANRPPVLQMSALEQALVDSNTLTDAHLGRLEVGDDQTIDQALRSPRNRAFVSDFIGKLSEAERAPLLRGDGSLSQQGLWRVKAAVFTKLFPGEAGQRLADTFLESLDSNIKNFEGGIAGAMPKLARADALIQAGRRSRELDISKDLSKSIDMLARLREQNMSVKDYLGQGSLFGRELSPFQERLLSFFDEIGRNPKKIREFLNGYADAVEAAPDPDQGSLFGGFGPEVTKASIIDRLISRARGTGTGAAAASLFDMGEFAAAKEAKRKAIPTVIPPLSKKNRVPDPDSLAAALFWDKDMPTETYDDFQKPTQKTKELGAATANATFTVFKDKKDRYRWITVSSTAFMDRDREIISTKALIRAVAKMEARRKYGPLRWWHVGGVTGGLDIGDCDFSMVHGRSLVESGTFRDERLAEKLKGQNLKVSIGYQHSYFQPDHERVFHDIDIFERSLLPSAVASNPYTAFAVAGINDGQVAQPEVRNFLEGLFSLVA